MNYRVHMGTVKAQDHRHKENEDRYMFSEISFMEDQRMEAFVIADGMGGLARGAHTAQQAVSAYMSNIYSAMMNKYMKSEMKNYSLEYAAEDLKDSMIEGIRKANEEVVNGMESYNESGTTISAVSIIGNIAVICNVGDSPVYYYQRKSRKLELISQLQTKAEQDVELGIYERYSKDYYSNDHMLYCYLGEYSNLQGSDIHVTSIGGIQEGDIIIAGSDGCFGKLKEHTLLGLLDGCSEEEEGFIINQLFEMARHDGDGDDQTAIMYVAAGEDKQ